MRLSIRQRESLAAFALMLVTFGVATFGGFAVPSAQAEQAGVPKDPLESVMWADMHDQFLAGHKVVFDDRVKVAVPRTVENQAQVPVTADARGLGDVRRMIVFADLNPIAHVLTLIPEKADAFVSFRMKVEQGTPVRAAALTADGVWHVGGTYLDAAGGGCSAPAMARNVANWADTLGQTQGRVWRRADGKARLRMRMKHPMDTGLARDNTPAFFLEDLEVRSPDGAVLARLKIAEPVSEDPTLTLNVQLPASAQAVAIDGRDNSGSEFKATIPAPSNPS